MQITVNDFGKFALGTRSLHDQSPPMHNRTSLPWALGITAVWGLNFSVIKLGVAHIDPLLLAALRFLLCSLPLLPWVPRPAVPWRWLVLYGLTFGVGTWGLMNLALRQNLSPVLGAWLLQASALLTPALAWVWLGERPRARQTLGSGVAAVGLLWVLAHIAGRAAAPGVALALAAAASLSVANVLVRRSGTKDNFGFLVWSCLFAPLPLLALVLAQGGWSAFLTMPEQLSHPVALAALVIQVVPVTLLGYTVWNRLLAREGTAVVAPLGLLVPLFAWLWSGCLLGQWPSAAQAQGMVAIGAGLALGLPTWRWRSS